MIDDVTDQNHDEAASIEPAPRARPRFDDRTRRQLRNIASASIACGLDSGKPRLPELDGLPLLLQATGASFVTLRRRDGTLRGCIGRLEAYRPLANDVADNAFGAAFRDNRFQPLTPAEWIDCTVKIAVLGVPEPLVADDERALLEQLVPGEDGLILEDGGRRGTFLPAVWSQLGGRRAFVQQLKRKIGWSVDHWSPTMKAWRYTVESF